jgi:hypothetical protein
MFRVAQHIRRVDVLPECMTNINHSSISLAGQIAYSVREAAIPSPHRSLEGREEGVRAYEKASVDGIEHAEVLANVHDFSLLGFDLGRIIHIKDGSELSVHREI